MSTANAPCRSRDPNRIYSFMQELENVWRCAPDIRFGQLVMNLSRDEEGRFQDIWEWDIGEFRRAFDRQKSLTVPEGGRMSWLDKEFEVDPAPWHKPKWVEVAPGVQYREIYGSHVMAAYLYAAWRRLKSLWCPLEDERS